MTNSDIKTRIAPSPTGALHVGTARTALFNYLFARRNKGSFILRIEDTDQERSEKKFEEDIIDGLRWLGITWDGAITRQSERTEIYRTYLQKLWDEEKIFFCPHAEEIMHQCDARAKRLPAQELGGVLRFKNDHTKPIVFEDSIRGTISFDPTLLGDFSLAKNFMTPLYNFAVVVDDAEMAISHVIRGEDHIANTPKQMLMQEALGFKQLSYAHLPLLLGTDRSKLSKRHSATSIKEYRDLGYLPEALLNFLALLGWNPGTNQELFSSDELVQLFSLERVQKAGAIFDTVKLDWMNGEYIRKKSPQELANISKPYLDSKWKTQDEYLEKVVALEQPRLRKLGELKEKVDYFFEEPTYDSEILRWKMMKKEMLLQMLQKAKDIVLSVPEADFDISHLQPLFLKEAETIGDRGALLWPLRAALSGKKASPGPFEIMAIVGKKWSVMRIETAITLCDTIKK